MGGEVVVLLFVVGNNALRRVFRGCLLRWLNTYDPSIFAGKNLSPSITVSPGQFVLPESDKPGGVYPYRRPWVASALSKQSGVFWD